MTACFYPLPPPPLPKRLDLTAGWPPLAPCHDVCTVHYSVHPSPNQLSVFTSVVPHCTWSPGPLPSLRDFGHASVLCTFSNMPPPAEIARSSQLSSSLTMQMVKYVMAGPSITVQFIAPTPLLQLDRAGHRVGSILYGLRPLWSSHCCCQWQTLKAHSGRVKGGPLILCWWFMVPL